MKSPWNAWPFVVLITLFFIGWIASTAGAATCPTEDELDAYEQLYKASVIRSIRFADEPDPREAMREDIFLEAELATRAAQEGITSDPLLQADIRHYQTQEILDTLLELRIPADAVTTDELQRYYKEHASDFVTTELVKFRHIFFLVPKGDVRAEKEKFEQSRQVKEKLDKGEDFASLAAEYSELESAKRNKGLVGPEKLSKLNPAIQKALKELAPGQTTGPLRTAYGWEILRLEERIAPRNRPFA
ncbi:MAG: peptidylprolyl isomerase, partial [Armatimonadota bacterium]